MYPYNSEDKENYNPEMKSFSPKRLVNHRRYKVLKEIVQRAEKDKENKAGENNNSILREKMEHAVAEEATPVPSLDFIDESDRKYGL